MNHNENGEGICSADKGSNRRIQTNDSFRIRKGGVKTRSRIRGARCRGGVGWEKEEVQNREEDYFAGCWVQACRVLAGCRAV